MRKVPKTGGTAGGEEDKFSRYTPTTDLNVNEGDESRIRPVVLPLTGLPAANEQAHDLSLRGEGSD